MDLHNAALLSELLRCQNGARHDPMADPLDGPEWTALRDMCRPVLWLMRPWRPKPETPTSRDRFADGTAGPQFRGPPACGSRLPSRPMKPLAGDF